ncbi:MAG: fibronectin type III domain-containing protein [Candidatus Pacebacteria bacterium]|nr:fibronectin type III domain-containing protein [Candidatus Paceibacterota bacterium]
MKNKLLFLLTCVFVLSAAVVIAAPPVKAPNPPRNFLANRVDNTNDIQLHWTDTSNNEEGFLIERDINLTGFQQVTSVNADVETFTDSGVIGGVGVYEYRVRAQRADDSIPLYSIYSDTTSVIVETPNAPSDLTATTSFEGVVLTWTDNGTNEDGFLIEKGSIIDGYGLLPTVVAFLDADTTTYVDTLATENGTYQYRVASYIGPPSLVGSSTTVTAYSDQVVLVIEETEGPFPVPSNLTVEETVSSGNLLNWTDNSTTEDGFEIERRGGPLFCNQFIVIASGPNNGLESNVESFTDNFDVCLCTSTPAYHDYRIRAFKFDGPSQVAAKIYTGYSNIATTLIEETPEELLEELIPIL